MIRILRAVALAAFAAASWLPLGSNQAAAQSYPVRPIRILVGFGPGSSADIVARVVGKQMEEKLGQPIVVENRPGNSSMTAAEAVARAPNDGYELFMATVAQTINPVFTRSDFDLRKARKQLEKLGVSVWTGVQVTGVDADGVSIGAERVHARTVLWAAGVAGSPLARMANTPASSSSAHGMSRTADRAARCSSPTRLTEPIPQPRP